MSTWDRYNTPGPTPGPKGAVSQHKAAASGYELPSTPRVVKTAQPEHKTGCTDAPGLTHMGRGKKRKR